MIFNKVSVNSNPRINCSVNTQLHALKLIYSLSWMDHKRVMGTKAQTWNVKLLQYRYQYTGLGPTDFDTIPTTV
jgi:hypothetical protein